MQKVRHLLIEIKYLILLLDAPMSMFILEMLHQVILVVKVSFHHADPTPQIGVAAHEGGLLVTDEKVLLDVLHADGEEVDVVAAGAVDAPQVRRQVGVLLPVLLLLAVLLSEMFDNVTLGEEDALIAYLARETLVRVFILYMLVPIFGERLETKIAYFILFLVNISLLVRTFTPATDRPSTTSGPRSSSRASRPTPRSARAPGPTPGVPGARRPPPGLDAGPGAEDVTLPHVPLPVVDLPVVVEKVLADATAEAEDGAQLALVLVILPEVVLQTLLGVISVLAADLKVGADVAEDAADVRGHDGVVFEEDVVVVVGVVFVPVEVRKDFQIIGISVSLKL